MAARGMGRGKIFTESEQDVKPVITSPPPTKVIEPYLSMLNKKARFCSNSPPKSTYLP